MNLTYHFDFSKSNTEAVKNGPAQGQDTKKARQVQSHGQPVRYSRSKLTSNLYTFFYKDKLLYLIFLHFDISLKCYFFPREL